MCDPLTAAGAVLTGGSIIAQNQAAKKVAASRRGIMSDEAGRQGGFSKGATRAFDRSLSGFDRTKQEGGQAQKVAARAAASQSNVTEQDTFAPTKRSAPEVVSSAIADVVTSAAKSGKEFGGRLAGVSGFGDQQFENRIGLNRSGQDIGKFADFARGSGAVVPMELAAANQKGGGLRTIADLFKAGGMLATLSGVMGAGPSWDQLGVGLRHGTKVMNMGDWDALNPYWKYGSAVR